MFVIADRRTRRSADTAEIRRDDGKAVGKPINDASPLMPCLRKAVDENERRTATGGDVVQRHAVGDDSVVLDLHKAHPISRHFSCVSPTDAVHPLSIAGTLREGSIAGG